MPLLASRERPTGPRLLPGPERGEALEDRHERLFPAFVEIVDLIPPVAHAKPKIAVELCDEWAAKLGFDEFGQVRVADHARKRGGMRGKRVGDQIVEVGGDDDPVRCPLKEESEHGVAVAGPLVAHDLLEKRIASVGAVAVALFVELGVMAR